MNIQIPKKLEFLIRDKRRYKVAYGGRGAGKSWAYADCLLVKSLERKCRILCARELQNSIKDSVHRLISDRIIHHKLESLFEITESEIRGKNGSIFLFKGLRSNIAEIKSFEGIDYCWIEEAQKVTDVSWDLLIPTIRMENSEIWISFNTGGAGDPVYRRFVLTPNPNVMVVKIGWRDNPWFPEVLRIEMEHDRANNPTRFATVWEGEPGAEGRFFTEFGPHLAEDPIQFELSSLEGHLFGSLDHGTTHATSFGLWYVEVKTIDEFIIHRLCSYYASGASTGEHARHIHEMIESFTWTMGYMPELVWADPSMWTQIKKDEFTVWRPIDEYANLFREHGHKTQFVKANNEKVNGCQVMKYLFRQSKEAPVFKYFNGYNKSFEDGMACVDTDENDSEKYGKQDGDDAADEARYGAVGCYSMVAVLRQRRKHVTPKTHLQKLLSGKLRSRAKAEDWYNR